MNRPTRPDSMCSAGPGWVPNLVTALRLILGIALPWAPSDWQFSILIVAGLSDLIDGWISRLLRVNSDFGQLLDPIADKMLVLFAVATALASGWISWLELLALTSRDATVLALSARALSLDWKNWRRLTPRLSGKIATWGQLLALLSLFWYRHPLPWLVWLAAAASVSAAIDYVHRAYRANASR